MLSREIVTVTDTRFGDSSGIVTGMVTKRRTPIAKTRSPRRVKLYLAEWRDFMGVKAVDCAIALDIERESYYRIEREPWRLNLDELETLAETIGVKSHQLRFPPPQKGQQGPISVDAELEASPKTFARWQLRPF